MPSREDRPPEPVRRAARRGRPPAAPEKRVAPPAEHRVEAVERALTILEAFADGEPAFTLAALARRTGLNPSTILRLSGSLVRFGHLRRGENGLFRLGPTTLRLGVRYRDSFALADHVRPALARLAGETRETAAFYVREGGQRTCLFRHQACRPVRHHVEEGARLPLDKGASAHVLVAFDAAAQGQASLRARGYVVSLGERDPESAGIAAPVFGPDGQLVGALGIAGLLSRLKNADLDALGRTVADEAARITSELSGRR